MKQSKMAVNYVPHRTDKQCRACAYWRSGACEKVAGPINADGSCDIFEAQKVKK